MIFVLRNREVGRHSGADVLAEANLTEHESTLMFGQPRQRGKNPEHDSTSMLPKYVSEFRGQRYGLAQIILILNGKFGKGARSSSGGFD